MSKNYRIIYWPFKYHQNNTTSLSTTLSSPTEQKQNRKGLVQKVALLTAHGQA